MTKRDHSTFRATHDRRVLVPEKFRAGLASLEKEFGPEGWEYDADFRKRAKVGPPDMTQFRDGFKDYQVEVPAQGDKPARIVWVATTKAAKKFRESLG